MDWEFFGIVATLTGATVVLSLTFAVVARIRADTKRRFLRPPPAPPPASPELAGEIRASLVDVDKRLSRIEERQEFTERLLEGSRSEV